jgi:hypothetical protein
VAHAFGFVQPDERFDLGVVEGVTPVMSRHACWWSPERIHSAISSASSGSSVGIPDAVRQPTIRRE